MQFTLLFKHKIAKHAIQMSFPNKISFSNFFVGYIINYFCCCLGFVCGTRELSSGAVNSKTFSIIFFILFLSFLMAALLAKRETVE